MRTTTGIGNDIVDLSVRENPMPSRRFLVRVFTPAERRRIFRSSEPRFLCWKTWAAKEAAYKALKTTHPEVVFAHAAFHVDSKFRSVRYGPYSFSLEWNENRQYVHCLARSTDIPSTKVHFSVRKISPTSQNALSRAARREALSLLKSYDSTIGVSVRRRNAHSRIPEPPAFVKNGRSLRNFRLSLSHDGRFVAAAIFLRGNR